MMAARICSSTVVFAPSLSLGSRERLETVSQKQRCRIASSGWSSSIFRHSSSLSRNPPARQVSSNLSPVQVREFSRVVTSFSRSPVSTESEEVFFDGGTHYGDLVANLIFGLTLVWLPLTLASVFRALCLRYRFTNLRITVMSGLLGEDRKDFSYEVVKGVRFIPRFIGEWGDLVIELKDGTLVDLRSGLLLLPKKGFHHKVHATCLTCNITLLVSTLAGYVQKECVDKGTSDFKEKVLGFADCGHDLKWKSGMKG